MIKLAVSGESPTEARFNYLRGPQENWKTGMRAYRRVLYENIYADTDSGNFRREKRHRAGIYPEWKNRAGYTGQRWMASRSFR
jgi:hypothetical protein